MSTRPFFGWVSDFFGRENTIQVALWQTVAAAHEHGHRLDSQSSLIRGAVSLALQDARAEAVSMADMMFSRVSVQQP